MEFRNPTSAKPRFLGFDINMLCGLDRLLLPNSPCTTGKGKESAGQTKVTYGFSLVKGKANHPMEDYHVANFIRTGNQKLGLFAIFDGHLGDEVPAYLQKNLFTNILNEKQFVDYPDRGITGAYEKTDQAILSHNPALGRGGSTAVTAILMTIDHEPSTERQFIEDKGGFVSNLPGDVPRVNGQLAVSRAFGDKSLKSHLRSDPDIRSADVTPNTELMILASDGLWKVMSNEEAVEVARKIKDPQSAAKKLTAEALKKDSKDDISCIVVRFKI